MLAHKLGINFPYNVPKPKIETDRDQNSFDLMVMVQAHQGVLLGQIGREPLYSSVYRFCVLFVKLILDIFTSLNDWVERVINITLAIIPGVNCPRGMDS